MIDPLADRMRVRKSHVIRLLDGSAGLLERLSADRTSLSIYTADEIYAIAAGAAGKGGAVIRGWGATQLLRDVPRVAEEIRVNDEAHHAILRRHFGVQWIDPEHYDLVLNTRRVSVEECVAEMLALVRAPQFAETESARQKLDDLALAARVRAALRRSPETRAAGVQVSSEAGRIVLSGATNTDEMLAFVEVASAVPGVRDVAYRSRPGEDIRPRFH